MHQYEAGGISFHCGAQVIPLVPKNKFLSASEIEKDLILDDDIHHATTKVIVLENPIDGEIYPIQELRAISALAKKHNIRTHLDGARLWNASAATSISISEYASLFDSVSLCFSKGLGAPIGSCLVGTKSLISQALRLRKLYGGGWRQAGVLAGAVHYALDHHLPLLPLDHQRALRVSKRLAQLGFPPTKSYTPTVS